MNKGKVRVLGRWPISTNSVATAVGRGWPVELHAIAAVDLAGSIVMDACSILAVKTMSRNGMTTEHYRYRDGAFLLGAVSARTLAPLGPGTRDHLREGVGSARWSAPGGVHYPRILPPGTSLYVMIDDVDAGIARDVSIEFLGIDLEGYPWPWP